MGQSIISRNNPAASGDKIGDIKFTQRELGNEWVKCDGSMVDPNVVSEKYANICEDNISITGQYKTLDSNYSMMSDAMQAEYDKCTGSNDTKIFFWDNGEQRGSGFIDSSIQGYDPYLTLFLELADGSIKQFRLSGPTCYYNDETTWICDPEVEVEFKASNSCTDKVALIYHSRIYYYNDYSAETDELGYGFICIDINNGNQISSSYRFATSASSGMIRETYQKAAISNDCLIGAIYYEAFEYNIPTHEDAATIIFSNNTSIIKNNIDILPSYPFSDNPHMYCKMIPTENNILIAIYGSYYGYGTEYAVCTVINALNGSTKSLTEGSSCSMIYYALAFTDSNDIPRVICMVSRESGDSDGNVFTEYNGSVFSLLKDGTITEEKYNNDMWIISDNRIIKSNKYNIQCIYFGADMNNMYDFSNMPYTSIEEFLDDINNMEAIEVEPNLASKDYYFNNDKFLIIDKKLFGPILPNLNDENAYVKVK